MVNVFRADKNKVRHNLEVYRPNLNVFFCRSTRVCKTKTYTSILKAMEICYYTLSNMKFSSKFIIQYGIDNDVSSL